MDNQFDKPSALTVVIALIFFPFVILILGLAALSRKLRKMQVKRSFKKLYGRPMNEWEDLYYDISH